MPAAEGNLALEISEFEDGVATAECSSSCPLPWEKPSLDELLVRDEFDASPSTFIRGEYMSNSNQACDACIQKTEQSAPVSQLPHEKERNAC